MKFLRVHGLLQPLDSPSEGQAYFMLLFMPQFPYV